MIIILETYGIVIHSCQMDCYFPNEILVHILSFTESLPIDTKLHFGVAPKRLVVEEDIQCKLKKICLRRASFYKNQKALEQQIINCGRSLLFEFVSIKLDGFTFWIDYHDYKGTIGYRIIKARQTWRYKTPTKGTVVSCGPYNMNTGLCMDNC